MREIGVSYVDGWSEKARSLATAHRAIEKIEAVESKDKPTVATKDGDHTVGNVIDLATYRAQRRHAEAISILEEFEPIEPGPLFAA